MIDQEFWNGSAASGAQIDRVLAHYNSPHVGKGDLMATVAKREGINPIVLLAILQEESAFGNARNHPSLKPENVSNPFSVHFNESAQGINKLRMPNGDQSTFEQSLNGVIEILKLCKGSPTPLSEGARKLRILDVVGWTARVRTHFESLKRRISAG